MSNKFVQSQLSILGTETFIASFLALKLNIERESHVSLIIYDILGRKVKTILDSQLQSGRNRLHWSGKNEDNNIVSNGVYIA